MLKGRIAALAVLVLATLLAQIGRADDVTLRSGQKYEGVTILSRTADSIEIQVKFGTVKLPLRSVESINGESLWSTPTPAPAASSDTATPPAVTEPGASPAAETAVPSPEPATSPAEALAESEASPEAAEAAPAKPPWPEYHHRLNMDFLLLGIAAFFAVWLGTVSAVQRDLFQRRLDPRFWSHVAIAFPGLGFLFYRGWRAMADQRERAKKIAANPNEAIAEREKQRARTGKTRRGFEFLDEDRKAVLVRNEGEISGLEHAEEVLEEALLERASDVHIEPGEDQYRVRFRVDGLMRARMTFSRSEGMRVVSALKTLAQIDVAEKRKAQDGRFRVRADDSDVDFRVATANSIFGEKVVIRILDRKAGLLGLSDLGMPAAMMEQFARVIHSRSGMILATGPTGSGKTSTLYAALSQLDALKLNIMTIEDPVEYELNGATQMPVNPKAGITYESGLRSLLRQDPDVIFVGEMRDIEAAGIALRAALTGHLVFSSLHTRDAIGTIIRLEEMGVERPLLSSSLLLLLAQRLVRVLCPACREPYESSADELAEIGIELPVGETIYRPGACDECDQTGYIGRTGIFEMIVFDDALRQAMIGGAGDDELSRQARENGYRPYREDGAEKVLLGITSIEEVLQAG